MGVTIRPSALDLYNDLVFLLLIFFPLTILSEAFPTSLHHLLHQVLHHDREKIILQVLLACLIEHY